MSDMISHFLEYLLAFVFYVPKTALRFVGSLLPDCGSFGVTAFTSDVSQSMVNWLRFWWPILQYVPWTFFWSFFAVIILYQIFKWAWGHVPAILSFVADAWWIIISLYVISFAYNLWTDSEWLEHAVWESAFGTSGITSSTVEGGGFGGGGGGSW